MREAKRRAVTLLAIAVLVSPLLTASAVAVTVPPTIEAATAAPVVEHLAPGAGRDAANVPVQELLGLPRGPGPMTPASLAAVDTAGLSTPARPDPREQVAQTIGEAIRTDRVQALLRAAPGLDAQVLVRALEAHACARVRGDVAAGRPGELLTVIDYALPSDQKRLWVLDLASNELVMHTWVAHGRGSGDLVASDFSNAHGSNKTSLGVFVTAETYHGRFGRSLRIDGLEPGVNDNARDRAIVIHGSDWVGEDVVQQIGKTGRSLGCPAVDDDLAQDLIDTIAGGSLVFSWYPEDGWLAASEYLNCPV